MPGSADGAGSGGGSGSIGQGVIQNPIRLMQNRRPKQDRFPCDSRRGACRFVPLSTIPVARRLWAESRQPPMESTANSTASAITFGPVPGPFLFGRQALHSWPERPDPNSPLPTFGFGPSSFRGGSREGTCYISNTKSATCVARTLLLHHRQRKVIARLLPPSKPQG